MALLQKIKTILMILMGISLVIRISCLAVNWRASLTNWNLTRSGRGIQSFGGRIADIPSYSYPCGISIAWNYIRIMARDPESVIATAMNLNFRLLSGSRD